MHIERLWSLNKKSPERARQLNINFTDLEKDKDGKTIYDFLEKAGIKEGDEDYRKILNSLTLKNGYFYIGDTLAHDYFYWRKVYAKKDESNDSKINVIKKTNKSEKPLTEKEEKRRDYMRGHWD
jgi:hypothetical protein